MTHPSSPFQGENDLQMCVYVAFSNKQWDIADVCYSGIAIVRFITQTHCEDTFGILQRFEGSLPKKKKKMPRLSFGNFLLLHFLFSPTGIPKDKGESPAEFSSSSPSRLELSIQRSTKHIYLEATEVRGPCGNLILLRISMTKESKPRRLPSFHVFSLV